MSNLLARDVKQWRAEERGIQTLMLPDAALWSTFDWCDRPRTWIDYSLFYETARQFRCAKIRIEDTNGQ